MTEPPRILQRLAEGYLLADGAMGTVLYSLGVAFDRSFDELCLTEPDVVRGVHHDYVAAGAELIETNTFGANAIRLAEHGLEGSVEQINRTAARLARQVADMSSREIFVGGSVGPLGVTLAPVGALSAERARGAFAEQIAALASGGVDLVVVETMTRLDEALAALAAAREVCKLPVLVSLSFGDDGMTADGAAPEHVVAALEAAGADIIGANCSTGPAPMLDVAARMVQCAARPISAMPNAGLPTMVAGRYVYTSSAAYMADTFRQMVAAGVRMVGGCCGTTPEYIALTAEALKSENGAPPRLFFPAPERVRAPSPEILRGPTHLQDVLGKRFAVTVEVDPPNGFDVASLLPRIRSLRDSGYVDAIDVADSPRARARMSAFALAALIQGELGVETVLHMACRHRNLVAVHSDLLGAHALGVRNIFVVMGDLPALGDYPDATVVNDVTATGLMSLLTQFNRGADLSGRPLDHPTAFHIGCAFNFTSPNLDRELALLEKKIAAGAQFALSQPVYDVDAVRSAVDRLGGRFPVPLLVGVLPLWNARHASFLHNEVPGIVVPERVLGRMERAGDNGREEGVAVAQEILVTLGGLVQGAYFMPPFGRYELVAEVMAGVPLEMRELSAEHPIAEAW